MRGPHPTPCVTFRRVAVSLRGPRQSPVLPFACCVGSMLSDGRCALCSVWRRFWLAGPVDGALGVVLVVAGVVLRFLLPTLLPVQVVHSMSRRVSVRVRPNCSTPPRVVPVVRHRPRGGGLFKF